MKIKTIGWILLILVCIFGLGQAATAGILVMKDGTILLGEVEKDSGTEIVFKTSNLTLIIEKSAILYLDPDYKFEDVDGLFSEGIIQHPPKPVQNLVIDGEEEGEASSNPFSLDMSPDFNRWDVGFGIGFTGIMDMFSIGPSIHGSLFLNDTVSFDATVGFGLFHERMFWVSDIEVPEPTFIGSGELNMRFHFGFKRWVWKPYVGMGIFAQFGDLVFEVEGDSWDDPDEIITHDAYFYLTIPVSLLYFQSDSLSVDIGVSKFLFGPNRFDFALEWLRMGIRF